MPFKDSSNIKKEKLISQLAWSLLTIQHLEAQQACGDNVDMELPKAA